MNVLITGKNGYIAKAIYNAYNPKFNFTCIGREDVDLTNSSAVRDWFEGKKFDAVIHTAIQGGNRLQPDTVDVLDNNLKMYYNLLENKDCFKRFINFGSGAEIYLGGNYYGMSKKIIAQSIDKKDNFYSIRIFGLFDSNEEERRFIKSSILRYIKKQPIIIHQNKRMDFYYMRDFLDLIDNYLVLDNPPKTYDCTYSKSLFLYDIANIINSLSDYTVPIKIESWEIGPNYTGRYEEFGAISKFQYGLENGIKEMYKEIIEKM